MSIDLLTVAPEAGLDEPETVGSDGLTIDTDFGSVDLVAIERALSGERLELTRAEHHYIATLIRTHLARHPRRAVV